MIMNTSEYLSENYIEQSGCIPIKIKKNQQLSPMSSTGSMMAQQSVVHSTLSLNDIKILLVTSGTTGENWVFPKGSIKKGESKKQAAKRETIEEAGLKGKIIKDLDPIILSDHHKGCNITYFPTFIKKKKMKKSEWEESSKRKRKWYQLSSILQVIGPLKPHIHSAIVSLQRTMGIYLNNINLQFNLSSLPISEFNSVKKEIENKISPSKKDEKKKKKKKKEKKQDKKEKKKERSPTTLSDIQNCK